MYENVLILSASSGAGHTRAAMAVERAFALRGGARRVRHIDILDHTSPIFSYIYGPGYIRMIRDWPSLMGFIYKHTDRPWGSEQFVRRLHRVNARRLIGFLKREKPDLIVCTHFLASEIVSSLKHHGRLSTPLGVVVTDMDAHSIWLCRSYERYFVAMEETREHLIRLGIDPNRIQITGIPIDPVFGETKDRRAMQVKHGLMEDAFTIIVAAGAFGVSPVEPMLRSMFELPGRVQIIALCGRSKELTARVQKIANQSPRPDLNIKVVGFTPDMDELMTAADVLLGKPGGLTLSESLAKGLVLAVFKPIPGQEERNADHLLEEGVAIRCNNLPTIGWKIRRLMEDPRRLAGMRERSLALGKANAAMEIVDGLMAMRPESADAVMSV